MDDDEAGRLEQLEAEVAGLTHVLTRLLDHPAQKDVIDAATLSAFMSETNAWPKAPEGAEAKSAVFDIIARSLHTAGVIRPPDR